MTKARALPCATLLLAALLALGCLAQPRDAGAVEAITIDFDASAIGTFPTGFSSAVTGGGPASWAVVEDFTAPSGGKVLAQTSTDKTSVRFPLCVYDGFMASDVTVSVSFKPVSGTVDQAAGLVARYRDKEGVFKVSMPRTDLDVHVAGVKMTPALGLTSWAAFHKMENQTMVIGDMVMLEDQVNPVMSAALENGIEVTALHNHFFWDTSKVMFMHIGGMGDEGKLAEAVGNILAKIKETSGGKGVVPQAEIIPDQTSLDPKIIEDILRVKGQLSNGVYKLTIGRTTTMDGHEVGNTMGVNTWAAFAGSNEQAMVDGDFAMLESELQPVLKALRGAGINIVAIHNHMASESPRIVFLHYWGIGATPELAGGLKAALDQTQHQ